MFKHIIILVSHGHIPGLSFPVLEEVWKYSGKTFGYSFTCQRTWLIHGGTHLSAIWLCHSIFELLALHTEVRGSILRRMIVI